MRYRRAMMMRTQVLAVAIALGAFACNKDAEPKPPPGPVTAPPTAGKVGSDGVRKVDIEAGKDGYVPARITGKPGEKLDLVFTRVADSECISQVKMPDGKSYDLPLGKPVDVAITVPASGELGFVCGMDMVRGAVVAVP
jgi:plastocyanin domain-containing protein